MKLYVDPGNEKYVKFAKSMLAKLSYLRKILKLPKMTKMFTPESGVLVHVVSSDYDDSIRITGGVADFPVFLKLPNVEPTLQVVIKHERLITYGYSGSVEGTSDLPTVVRIHRNGSDGTIEQIAEFISEWQFTGTTWVGGYQLHPGPSVAYVPNESGAVIVWTTEGQLFSVDRATAKASDNRTIGTIDGTNWPTQAPSTPYRKVFWTGGTTLYILGFDSVIGTAALAIEENMFAPIFEEPPFLWNTTEQLRNIWTAGYNEALQRKRTFNKNCSDRVIEKLRDKTYVLSNEWNFTFKNRAPVSDKTERPILLNEETHTRLIQDNTNGFTQDGSRVMEREVKFTYTVGEEVRSETIIGSVTTIRTSYPPAGGGAPRIVFTHTYSDWYEPRTYDAENIQFITPQKYRDVIFFEDSFTSPGLPPESFSTHTKSIGTLWDGTIITGGRNANPNLGTVTDPFVDETFGASLPFNADTLVPKIPSFYSTYHQTQKPRSGAGNKQFLSSGLMPGMKINVVPFGIVAGPNVLGMFWELQEGEEITEIEIYGTAVFSYDYNTGALTFESWRSLTDSDGNAVESKRIPIPEGYSLIPNTNAVAYYSGTPFSGLKQSAVEYMNRAPDGFPAPDMLEQAIRGIM